MKQAHLVSNNGAFEWMVECLELDNMLNILLYLNLRNDMSNKTVEAIKPR